jgi:hypothetical protein
MVLLHCNVLCAQVSLLVDQVDQYDSSSSSSSSSHAALTGIRAEPQQPELPRLRQALAAADKVVMLVEGADVSQLHVCPFDCDTHGCAWFLCLPCVCAQMQFWRVDSCGVDVLQV